MESIAKLLTSAWSPVAEKEHEQKRRCCHCKSVHISRALLLSLSSFFEFTNPQFDSAGNFSRPLRIGQLGWINLLLVWRLVPFDDSDLAIHDLSLSWS
jgi:hypothetical protein